MTTQIVAMLKRYAADECNSPDDIRDFVLNDAEEFTLHLGDSFVSSCQDCADDKLSAWVAYVIKACSGTNRASKHAQKQRAAQEAADAFALTCTQVGGKVELGSFAKLAECFTVNAASLCIHGTLDGAEVIATFQMGPGLGGINGVAQCLLARKKDKRGQTARAWVEFAPGDRRDPVLRIRWTNSCGTESGYNFRGTLCQFAWTWIDERVTVCAEVGTNKAVIGHAADVHLHVPVREASVAEIDAGWDLVEMAAE